VEDDEEFPLSSMKFESMLQADVPKGRDGKHKRIIMQLLSDIAHLSPGSALKVPLTQLPDTKENIRAALSRAARMQNLKIATSSNEEFLYVWKIEDSDEHPQ
jgi:TusA-related sulfurtransferase